MSRVIVDPDDLALSAAEHYLRATALASAALATGARADRLARLLGAAEIHARLALVPDEIAAEARASLTRQQTPAPDKETR